MVSVRVTLDPREQITGVELRLARSFIDSPTDGEFANDIAKSMMVSTPPRGDVDALAELARRSASASGPAATEYASQVGLRRRYQPSPQLDITPTSESAHGTSASCRRPLQIGAIDEGGEPWLRIRITLRRSGKG